MAKRESYKIKVMLRPSKRRGVRVIYLKLPNRLLIHLRAFEYNDKAAAQRFADSVVIRRAK